MAGADAGEITSASSGQSNEKLQKDWGESSQDRNGESSCLTVSRASTHDLACR